MGTIIMVLPVFFLLSGGGWGYSRWRRSRGCRTNTYAYCWILRSVCWRRKIGAEFNMVILR
jgi:hypothetical protein